jgi:hypothetical protein
LALIFSLGSSFFPSAMAQSPAPSGTGQQQTTGSPLPRFGLAVSASTLGGGIQAATAVTRHSNVRFGFNYFTPYSATFNKDGIAYNGTLNLRSAEVLYDQYFKGSFHISPGVMVYDGNKVTATVSVPDNQPFTLGGVTYFSQAGNDVSGAGALSTLKVAPMILVGFGNLLPRSSRHFTVNFDLGVVFQGSPKAALNLTGGVCTAPNLGCVNVGTNSVVQANVQSEQTTIDNALSIFKFYPVVSLSFGYKF